jgi:hypothetical protein
VLVSLALARSATHGYGSGPSSNSSLSVSVSVSDPPSVVSIWWLAMKASEAATEERGMSAREHGRYIPLLAKSEIRR